MNDPKPDLNELTPGESSEPVSKDVEELTSYLDGELTPSQMQAVEVRLADDQEYRREMQQLQKAWDLLDQLPHTDSSAQFTRSTIEMVVQNATIDVKKRKSPALGWLARAALLMGLPLTAFGVSQWTTRNIQLAPQRKLVNDLTLIENVDVYRKAENIEFLSALSTLELFDDIEIPATEPLLLNEVPFDQTVHSIGELKQLDVEKLDELRRKRKMFSELASKSQQDLRDFHLRVTQHENVTHLVETMRRYYSWLRTLPDEQQILLLDLPRAQRIERIRELLEEYASDLFGKTSATELPAQDASTVYDWIKRTQNKKFGDLMAHLQSDEIREKLMSMNSSTGRRPYPMRNRPGRADPSSNEQRRAWLILTKLDPGFVSNLVFEEIEELRARLSQEALEIFERHEGEEQRKLVLNWIVTATKAKQHVSDETLHQFYDEVLTAEMRDEFDKMTPENFLKRLKIEYLRHQYRSQFNQRSRGKIDKEPAKTVSEGT